MDLSNLNEDDQTFIEGNLHVFMYLVNIICNAMCFISYFIATILFVKYCIILII